MNGRDRHVVERRPVTVVTALFLSAAAWTAFVVFAWALVPWACERDVSALLHAVAGLTLAAGAAGTGVAVRLVRSERDDARGAEAVALVAVALSALFTAGIALFWVFTASFDPCWR